MRALRRGCFACASACRSTAECPGRRPPAPRGGTRGRPSRTSSSPRRSRRAPRGARSTRAGNRPRAPPSSPCAAARTDGTSRSRGTRRRGSAGARHVDPRRDLPERRAEGLQVPADAPRQRLVAVREEREVLGPHADPSLGLGRQGSRRGRVAHDEEPHRTRPGTFGSGIAAGDTADSQRRYHAR